eukprot:Clim_evm54s251 gene=Clim_evmTU54s251
MSGADDRGGLDKADITAEELNRFNDSMKQDEFKKMFFEYVKEMQDPDVRVQREAEICKVEAEAGNSVGFITPTPGFVFKLRNSNGEKVFVNVGHHTNVDPPVTRKVEQEGKSGYVWDIPNIVNRVSQSSKKGGREDKDKDGNNCRVYDVVFNPLTLNVVGGVLKREDLVDTCIDTLNRHFPECGLVSKDIKYPRMKYKGDPPRIMARALEMSPMMANMGKKLEEEAVKVEMERRAGDGVEGAGGKETNVSIEAIKDIDLEHSTSGKDVLSSLRNEVQSMQLASRMQEVEKEQTARAEALAKRELAIEDGYMRPVYSLKYGQNVEYADYWEHKESGTGTTKRPSSITVQIGLPGTTSSRGLDVDVDEDNQILTVTHIGNPKQRYMLKLKLAYPVNEEKAEAQYEKSTAVLSIVLPVVQKRLVEEVGIAQTHTDSAPGLVEEIPTHVDDTSGIKSVEEATEEEEEDEEEEPKDDYVMVDKDVVADPLKEEGEESVVKATTNLDSLEEFPPIEVFQDETTATLVLKLAEIEVDSVELVNSESPNAVLRGLCNVYGERRKWAAVVHVPGGVDFDGANATINVTPDSAVVIFPKKGTGEWQKLLVGPSISKQQTVLFDTEENAKFAIAERMSSGDPWNTDHTARAVGVDVKTADAGTGVIEVHLDDARKGLVPATGAPNADNRSAISSGVRFEAPVDLDEHRPKAAFLYELD